MPTIKQKAIEQSAVCTKLILKRGNLSNHQYKLMFFEIGCQFIERLFDVRGYEDMMDFYLKDPTSRYWKWWRAEWINHERMVYTKLQESGALYPNKHDLIVSTFSDMLTSDLVGQSFNNHCKYLAL